MKLQISTAHLQCDVAPLLPLYGFARITALLVCNGRDGPIYAALKIFSVHCCHASRPALQLLHPATRALFASASIPCFPLATSTAAYVPRFYMMAVNRAPEFLNVINVQQFYFFKIANV